jgi:hypothetical protein
MPTMPVTKKRAKSTSPGEKKRRSLNAILGENQTLKAWLRPGKDSPTEAFVILAECQDKPILRQDVIYSATK